eukprot:jgi/Bigna1/76926/fgenesh1_pg.44_\
MSLTLRQMESLLGPLEPQTTHRKLLKEARSTGGKYGRRHYSRNQTNSSQIWDCMDHSKFNSKDDGKVEENMDAGHSDAERPGRLIERIASSTSVPGSEGGGKASDPSVARSVKVNNFMERDVKHKDNADGSLAEETQEKKLPPKLLKRGKSGRSAFSTHHGDFQSDFERQQQAPQQSSQQNPGDVGGYLNFDALQAQHDNNALHDHAAPGGGGPTGGNKQKLKKKKKNGNAMKKKFHSGREEEAAAAEQKEDNKQKQHGIPGSHRRRRRRRQVHKKNDKRKIHYPRSVQIYEEQQKVRRERMGTIKKRWEKKREGKMIDTVADNSNTRERANTWMTQLTGRPPFMHYGTKVSHNKAPEIPPNFPPAPQVYHFVREKINKKERLQKYLQVNKQIPEKIEAAKLKLETARLAIEGKKKY